MAKATLQTAAREWARRHGACALRRRVIRGKTAQEIWDRLGRFKDTARDYLELKHRGETRENCPACLFVERKRVPAKLVAAVRKVQRELQRKQGRP